MERPTVRSYAIRRSRITDAQREARSSQQASFGIKFQPSIVDFAQVFPVAERIIMEIGFGMGEATAIIASENPKTGYIAVDVHPPGVGKLLARISDSGLTNIRVIEDDAHVVLQHMIADETLSGIHLFFPDPWPKNKHNKRRIVNAGFLHLIYPKLKMGGYIHIATDWVPYALSIQTVFAGSKQFSGGVVAKPQWRPVTHFEGQGIDKDHAVNDMLYTKV